MDAIRAMTAQFDTCISTEIGQDMIAEIAGQMVGVVALAALVIVGTNFWLGEISSITNSIAVIMQLALAIDYAIIFSHRYQDETERFPTEYEALIEALSKSIVEISSSSLTTIAGLVALTLMQFRLGYDLGVVLTKGILCAP